MTAPTSSAGSVRPTLTRDQAQAVADKWPQSDVDIAAFHLAALGASRREAADIIETLAWHNVGRIKNYVARFTEADLDRWTRTAELVRLRTVAPGRRGDLIRPPLPRRWKWRTSSGQERGEAYG